MNNRLLIKNVILHNQSVDILIENGIIKQIKKDISSNDINNINIYR